MSDVLSGSSFRSRVGNRGDAVGHGRDVGDSGHVGDGCDVGNFLPATQPAATAGTAAMRWGTAAGGAYV